MKLVPLADRLVIKQVVAEETTKSGIVLPGQAKEKPQEAVVVAVGKGVDGDVIKEGDTVIYSKYAGNTVKVDDEEYIIVKEEDVLAIVK
jgi:chaperonin GroES